MVKKQAPISRTGLQEVVGKLLLDPGFQKLFRENPRHAVENAGIALTDNEYDVLLKLEADLKRFASSPGVEELAKSITMYTDRTVVSPTT